MIVNAWCLDGDRMPEGDKACIVSFEETGEREDGGRRDMFEERRDREEGGEWGVLNEY
jgi:hypothetical protein